MFNDLLGEIRKEANNLANNKILLLDLEKELAERYQELYQQEANLNYLRQSSNEVGKLVLVNMENEKLPLKILYESLKSALQTNKEYNHPFFTEGLLIAINNPKTIDLVVIGNSIVVLINLDNTAGDIQSYANAVNTVAIEMSKNSGKIMTSAQMASYFWREKFYLPAREGKEVTRRKWNKHTKSYEKIDVTEEQIEKYWRTMKKRLQMSGKPAPYWEIIDKGSAVMPSRGGSAYPTNKPTNFVNRAATKIRLEFEKRVNKGLTSLGDTIRNIVLQIEFIKNRIEEIKFSIEKLKLLTAPEVRLLDRVIKSGRKYCDAKLNALLLALHNMNLEGISVTKEGRVELTVPGEKRYRVSIRRYILELGLGQ